MVPIGTLSCGLISWEVSFFQLMVLAARSCCCCSLTRCSSRGEHRLMLKQTSRLCPNYRCRDQSHTAPQYMCHRIEKLVLLICSLRCTVAREKKYAVHPCRSPNLS